MLGVCGAGVDTWVSLKVHPWSTEMAQWAKSLSSGRPGELSCTAGPAISEKCLLMSTHSCVSRVGILCACLGQHS